MGCDVHMYVEKKRGGKWVAKKGPSPYKEMYEDFLQKAIEKGDEKQINYYKKEVETLGKGTYEGWIYSGRNYDVFAMLADVRNDEGIVPISEPKGLPDDMSSRVKRESDSWEYDGHSHSYLTLTELMNYDWNSEVTKRGIVSEKEYTVFKENGYPTSWCGGVGGGGVRIISNDEMEELISGKMTRDEKFSYYTEIKWVSSYVDRAKHFLDTVIPKLEELAGDDPDSVRLVFWFDN